MTELFIKNMVCRHCKAVVADILETLGFTNVEVKLGRASIAEDVSRECLGKLEILLRNEGFELVKDPDQQLVERVKLLVMNHVREERGMRHNLSLCVERKLNVSYDTVSRIFSQCEGRTLEKYHIAQKIERVKELMQYDEYTLSEIAYMVDYSSVAHLSRQFKAVVGMTPSEYLRGPRVRKGLNEI